MKEKISRRSFLKKIWKSGLALIGLTVSIPTYSYFGERKWLQTNQIKLSSKRIPSQFSGLKIVHFSDLHLGFHMDDQYLDDLIKQVNAHYPDIICFTGDLVDEDASILEAYIPKLQQFEASYGKFAVLGNHDYRSRTKTATGVTEALRRSEFNLLVNENIQIKRNNAVINISGVDDIMDGNPNLDKTLLEAYKDTYTILLVHEPDFADVAQNYPIDLQLSGHSHGGQIRLPLIGHIITPPMAKKYVNGLYEVGDSLKVYTNKGIGTTIYPFRFFCRPEITVITLETSSV
ncbi:metallophosphoesterase [Chengkuizengella sediminis]|uniref:metallophosphoesterase n=1 Tax=Chengkuizengella sediminis TaxID=1885917 RepID=UPI0013895B9F|nr:metallophosphoesterase [Chengkuizengella sediminis]NDI35939.1 metallophosphoesterase [Chengkuizengella sediminis]